MKRILIVLFTIFAMMSAKGQTNIQEMYDINRNQMTTTLEHFNIDDYGSNFFFVDIYHKFDNNAPTDFYTEISRSFNFWKDSKMKDFSLHAEFNGGCGIFGNDVVGGYKVNNAWLFGGEYFIHSKDYRNTLNVSLLYKNIIGKHSSLPIQATIVFTMNDLFNVKNLTFTGFADFWMEDNYFGDEITKTVFLSEPQIWYSFGNLSIGGEVEISNNFTGNVGYNKGWQFNPAIGLKYVMK